MNAQAATTIREEDGMYRLASSHSQLSILLTAQDLIELSAMIQSCITDNKSGESDSATKVRYRNGTVTNDDEDKEITERDQQAMYNFAAGSENTSSFNFEASNSLHTTSSNYVPIEAIAENYGCSVTYVEKVVNTRPWLRTKPQEDSSVNLTWWESDHSDPLELVKIFFYKEGEVPEITVKEKCEEMTWQEYINTVDWTDVGDDALEVIREEMRKRKSG